ncbi:MAG: type II toxin-antitoxin system VapC family toxin [Gemmatimonadota bacterium]
MNPIFVDTSALFALLAPSDEFHDQASRIFHRLRDQEAPLVSTSYVLVESYALAGRRLGIGAIQILRTRFAPLFELVWVDETLHDRGLDLLVDRSLQSLSLVDAVSFLTIRDAALGPVFAFDHHFVDEGFTLLQ